MFSDCLEGEQEFDKKIFPFTLLMSLLATGCASQSPASGNYDPVSEARVRVYFGATTHFYFNTRCEPKKGLPGFGDSGMAVAMPRLRHLANTAIGMPVPVDTYTHTKMRGWIRG